jgi:hypothetical protein
VSECDLETSKGDGLGLIWAVAPQEIKKRRGFVYDIRGSYSG